MSDKKDQRLGDAPEATSEDDEKTILFQPIPKADPAPKEPDAVATPDDVPAVDEDAPESVIEDDDDRTIMASDFVPPVADVAETSKDVVDPVPEVSAAVGAAAVAAAAAVDDDDDDRTVVVSDVRRKTTAPVTPSEVTTPPPMTNTPPAGAGTGPATMTSTASVIPPSPGAAPTPLSSLEPGTIINNMYRVEERLDQGGMGSVFRGTETSTGENVAIKVILPEMAEDDKVTAMFRREARTMRQLHHDAIVRYFAYVPPNQTLNLHAIIMGFIEGTKLSDAIKENGAMTQSQTIDLTMKLADGLDRAHNIGVVHRDLSPDNVMLQNGDLSKPVLIDFGISRSDNVKEATIGNEFAGKLKYVSPEQMGAFGGQAEGPSDVYSLGLLMIGMLTGTPMPMGTNFVEAVQKRQSVPDLSFLPEDFQGLVGHMLQPDPKERLPSMAAVIEELRVLKGETGLGTGRPRYTKPPVEDRVVPGLQSVPMAARSSTSSPSTMPPAERVEEKSGGKGLFVGFGLVALLAAGAAAFFLMGDGLPSVGGEEPVTAGTVEEGLTRVEGTRAAFLAQAVPEVCTFAGLRSQGPNAGLIEGFGRDLAPLQDLGSAFGAQFGSNPEVVPRGINESQCAVLDLVKSFQGTQGTGIELALSENTMSRANGVLGTVHGSAGRQNWLALVDPNGQVFSLMRQLDDPIGDERRFSFRLPSAAPGIYMVVALASDAPLVRAGAMQDGTLADTILPLMTRELALDGQGAVDIAYLELTR
ncbi:MAG: serine/threonine-protein kinase [Tateyamaria sp.]|uniref:serine/threonine-protein kinase n=1 Tax=Tateyamaria sp. TaxID=1929288 RepID=UPI0032A136FD